MTVDVQPERLVPGLEKFLEQVRVETRIPGIGVALSVAGRRAYAHAGTLAADDPRPLTAAARFHLGCVVKALLALVTLELVRRGELDLDAPLAAYLAELRGTRHGHTVRVRHLLSHTSGYQGTSLLVPGTRKLTWAGFVAYLRDAPQLFVPGTVFNYEHSEAVLLEKLVTRATDMDALRLIRQIVLAPLGIREPVLDTCCESAVRVGHHAYDTAAARFVRARIEPPPPFWRAAFSCHTLALCELIVLAEALADDRPDGPFPASTLSRMREAAVTLPPTVGGALRELMPISFGLGAAGLRGGWHGHTGVAQGQCIGLRYDPSRRIAVAVGLNVMAPPVRDLILSTICASLTGATRLAEQPEPRLELELAELAGEYRGAGGVRVVAAFEDGRLCCEIGAPRAAKGLRVELVADERRGLKLITPLPQLSLGFFKEPAHDSIALMVGMNAYKRVADHTGGHATRPHGS